MQTTKYDAVCFFSHFMCLYSMLVVSFWLGFICYCFFPIYVSHFSLLLGSLRLYFTLNVNPILIYSFGIKCKINLYIYLHIADYSHVKTNLNLFNIKQTNSINVLTTLFVLFCFRFKQEI